MSPKAAVVILAVLVVLFVVGIAAGASPGNNQPSSSPASFSPSGPLQSLGDLLGPFSPKLQLNPSRFGILPGQAKAVPIPASSQPFLRATFALTAGSRATIKYCAPTVSSCSPVSSCPSPPTGNAGPKALDTQCLDLPRSNSGNGDPKTGSLAIQKAGGTLQLFCSTPAACVIQLE